MQAKKKAAKKTYSAAKRGFPKTIFGSYPPKTIGHPTRFGKPPLSSTS